MIFCIAITFSNVMKFYALSSGAPHANTGISIGFNNYQCNDIAITFYVAIIFSFSMAFSIAMQLMLLYYIHIFNTQYYYGIAYPYH